jgi:hypothetical protein
MSLNIITWDLKSKSHRQTSLEVLMEGGSPLNRRANRLEWVLDYDAIHMIEPGMSSEMCVTESGVTIYQAQAGAISLSICKVREISTLENKVVSVKDFQVDGDQPPLLFEDEPLRSLKHGVVIIPEQESDGGWRYYYRIASLDCWIYSLRNQYPTYHPPQYLLGSRSTAPRPISSSTHGVMVNASQMGPISQGVTIKLINWGRGQQILPEVVPEMLEKEDMRQIEHESTLRTDFLGRGSSISRGIVRSSSHWPWFGNHRFFILATCRKITVYCFDKTFPLANEDISYRRGREEKAKARKAKRLHSCFSPDSTNGCSNVSPWP